MRASCLLRWVVGLVFVSAACLKILALNEPRFSATIAWRYTRDERVLLAFAAFEAGLGALFALDLWRRWVGVTMIGLLLVLTGILAWDYVSLGEARPCGCFGVAGLGPQGGGRLLLALAHNAALMVAAFLGAEFGTGRPRSQAAGR